MDVFGLNSPMFGVQGGAPVFDIQGIQFNQTGAQGAYSACSFLGGDPDTCGKFGAQAGISLGNLNTQSAIDAYNSAGQSSSNNSTKEATWAQKIAAIATLPLGGNISAQAGIHGNSIKDFLSSPTTIATFLIGIILIAGGIFMLKSPVTIATSALKGAIT